MPTRHKVILMMETSRTFGRSIIRGMARYAHEHGNWIFYKRAPFYWGTRSGRDALGKMLKMGIDGLVLREQRMRQRTEEILGMDIPTVVSPYTEPFSDVPNIITDDVAIGEMAAEHLLDRGLRQFAYCGFGQTYYWSRERGKGFCRRISQAGFEAHYYEYERPGSETRHSWEKEQDMLVNWLKGLPKPVGLMACNDDRSQYVLEACKIAELHVPDEIAVVGLGNDDLICDLVSPPLSSVALSAQKAGYEAAAVLDRMMAGEKVSSHTIPVRPTHVVTRQSTDIFAVADPDVLAALNYIHQRAASEAIQVDDVLAAVSLSRRTLYERFAKMLGRSVHEEIKRVRVDRLARLLVSTDQPISQIATSMGYSDFKNIARYFKQHKGMTPSQYRKSHSVP